MTDDGWQYVRSFVAIAEHKSFTRAAKALGISASALSQSMRALEAKLGVPLLHRTTRSVALTERGQELLNGVAPSVKTVSDALAVAATPKGALSGSLRITVPAIAVPTVIAPMVARFITRHPRVAFEVNVDNRLSDIVAERYDAGVRLKESVQRDMVTTRLSKPFRFVVVGSPGYLRRYGVPSHPRELAKYALIGFRSPTSGSLIPWDLERRGRVFKVPTRGPLSTNSDSMLLDGATRGLGLAYVSEVVAAKAISAGKLTVVLPDWAPEVPGFFLYYPSRNQTSANLRAFIELAQEGKARNHRV